MFVLHHDNKVRKKLSGAIHVACEEMHWAIGPLIMSFRLSWRRKAIIADGSSLEILPAIMEELYMFTWFSSKSLSPLRRYYKPSEDKFLWIREMKQKLKLNMSSVLARLSMSRGPTLRPLHLQFHMVWACIGIFGRAFWGINSLLSTLHALLLRMLKNVNVYNLAAFCLFSSQWLYYILIMWWNKLSFDVSMV